MNQNFDEIMEAGVSALVEAADVSAAAAHATYSVDSVILPEGVTIESLNQHVAAINNISAQVEGATAQLARSAWESNNDVTNFDATLALGPVTFNSQHVLRQELGESTIFGQSTTTSDYVFSDELNNWQEQLNTSNAELAAKLFS